MLRSSSNSLTGDGDDDDDSDNDDCVTAADNEEGMAASGDIFRGEPVALRILFLPSASRVVKVDK